MALAEQFAFLGIPLSTPTPVEQPVHAGMQNGLQVVFQEDKQGRVCQLLTDPATHAVVDESHPMEGHLFNKFTNGGWRLNLLRRIVWIPSEAPSPVANR